MYEVKSVEIREHNKNWFEIKVWLEGENGIINLTEEHDISDEKTAREKAIKIINEKIQEGINEINFFHSKKSPA